MDDIGKTPNMTDRERIIEIGAAVREVCRNIKSLKAENASEHKSISDKIDSVVVNKVPYKLFYSALGVVIAVLFALSSAIGVLNMKVSTVEADIEHIEHKINRVHPKK